MKILITGAYGFIGKNLTTYLTQAGQHQLYLVGRDVSWSRVADSLATVDFVFHLAGVNRPQSDTEFQQVNAALTEQICQELLALGKKTPIVLSSSIQAALDNPYGQSKRNAEAAVRNYAEKSGATVHIYRLPGVFGKWCRPNYNSVVATFCHNIAHDESITIRDPDYTFDLVYIDDVVQHFVQQLDGTMAGVCTPIIQPVHQTTLGALAAQIRAFHQGRTTLLAPNFADPFVHKLYATYLSYLEADDFCYALEKRSDPRGSLAEFIKLPAFGQIFVSRTNPGITRGNHYHHTKTEKFLVLEGEAIVRFRAVDSEQVLEYPVCGSAYQVIDIPPGYTHSIENVGDGELVTLFWASELFDPQRPDTHYVPVFTTEDEHSV